MKRARHIYGRPSARVSFPTALLGAGLSPSEVYVYVLLLDRAASAAASEKTPSRDPEEEPFICFPVQELAEALGRSAACIKLALAGLERRGLLTRRQQGGGLPYRLYLKPFEELPHAPEA